MKKHCQYLVNGYCVAGWNEFDGLCSIEACDLPFLQRIWANGIKLCWDFWRFEKTERKKLLRLERN